MGTKNQKLGMEASKYRYKGRDIVLCSLQGFPKVGRLPLIDDIFNSVKKFNREHGTRVRIIRPTIADYLFSTWLHQCRTSFLTNAGLVFEAPNKKLGQEVVAAYDGGPRMVFEVPREYRGERNIALLLANLKASNFDREGGDVIFKVPETRVRAVPDFPAKDGFYALYTRTTVPYGKEVEPSHNSRWLARNHGSYVGPLVRYVEFRPGFVGYYYSARTIRTVYGGFDAFDVLVEVPERDFARFDVHGPNE